MSGNPSDQDELIAQFTGITGTTSERSKFYLEASGWEFQVAVSSYYEDEAGGMEMDSSSSSPAVLPESTLVNPARIGSVAGPPGAKVAAPDATGAVAAKPPKRTPGNHGMATLNSLLHDDSSSDDEHQAFYAGGSSTSGQQVLGPPKKKDELIKELFEKAREHGATADEPGSGPEAATRPRFGGAGYKLGDTASGNAAPEVVTGSQGGPPESRTTEVILRLWRTGFTVDDGELRLYAAEGSADFLNAIKRGEIPRELIRSHPGQEVELAMEDKRHEDYAPPKPSVKPFGGKGQTLGSPSPTVVGSTAVLTTPTDREANELAARSQLNLAESEPSTNIQIRLVDGTRLVGRFNHTHTVGDVYGYINTARPQFTLSNYTLVLFPSTELTAKELTIKDANLLNAALTQKIKPGST